MAGVKEEQAVSSKSTAALKVLNLMMEATGSSMEECRAMLSSCGGDPNKATEQLVANPFQKVSSKAKPKQEDKRHEGPGSRGATGRGGYAGSGGRSRGSGTRTGYGDQHGTRDQQESKGYHRSGEGRGFSGRGGRGGSSSAAKMHETNGHSTPTQYSADYSSRPNDDAPAYSAAHSTSQPATAAHAQPVVATTPAASGPANGWGSASGTGKTFAERLKANLAKQEEAKASAPVPAEPLEPFVESAQTEAEVPAEYHAEYAADEYHVDDYHAEESHADEYYAADDTQAPVEQVADSVDVSDQITTAPAPASAPAYQPAAPAWSADAGKLIMSSLRSSASPQVPPEQTLSASDNPVAAPAVSSHQYSAYSAAPAVAAPAEHKATPDIDAAGLQLAFGTFGIGGGGSGLGDFGAQFSVQNPYPTATGAQEPLAQAQAPQPTPQPTAAVSPAPVAQAPQTSAVQPASPSPPPAPITSTAPIAAAVAYSQPTVQQEPAMPTTMLDPYKAAYSSYNLQANLGGDKVLPPAVPAAQSTSIADASRAPAQVPISYNHMFGQAQAAYGGFAAFGHDMNQPSYAAVQQAFSQDYPDPHKAAAAAAYTAPVSTGINAGYGSAPGYGAQSAAPPPSAAYNTNTVKYTGYSQPSQSSAAPTAMPSAPAPSMASNVPPPSNTAAPSDNSAQMPAASNMQSSSANASSSSAMTPATVQQQQQQQQALYGNPSAAAMAPALNPGGVYGYNMYGNYGNAGQNMYAATMYGQYGYAAPYSQGYAPQASTGPYPAAGAANPTANLYAPQNPQQRSYGASQMPAGGYGGSSYGLTGYDDLSSATSQQPTVAKDKDVVSAASALAGYSQMSGAGNGGPVSATSAGQQVPSQGPQQAPGGGQAAAAMYSGPPASYGSQQQQAYGNQQGYGAAQQQGYNAGGPGGYGARQGVYGGGQGGYGQGQGRGGRGNQAYNQSYRQGGYGANQAYAGYTNQGYNSYNTQNYGQKY